VKSIAEIEVDVLKRGTKFTILLQLQLEVLRFFMARKSVLCLHLVVLAVAADSGHGVSSQGGCVGTIAGVPLHAPFEEQPALLASLSLTAAAVVDPLCPGSVILPLFGRVVYVRNSGMLSVLAGGGEEGFNSPVFATEAALQGPTFVAPDRSGLLIADSVSIRRIDTSGALHVVAGNVSKSPMGTGYAGLDHDGASAQGAIITPTCLYADEDEGDIYFSNGNVVAVIRAEGPTARRLSFVAGNGSTTFVDGVLATATGFSDIRDLHTAPNGDLLIAVNDNYVHPRIVRVSVSDGIARTIIGKNAAKSGTSSITQHADSAYFSTGDPATTSIVAAVAVCTLTNGTVIFTDGTLIGSLSPTPTGTLTVIAGRLPSKKAPIIDGGLASETTFYRLLGLRRGRYPEEIIITDVGVVYRLNLDTQRVYAVAGRVQFVNLTPALSRPPQLLLATSIPLPWPYDVKMDPTRGDIYAAVATGNVVVRVSASDGTMSVIAGTGIQGCGLGDAADATLTDLDHPTSIALDGSGGLIIADRRCCLLRRLDTQSGALQILAGMWRFECSRVGYRYHRDPWL
jgi:hypothetical protein